MVSLCCSSAGPAPKQSPNVVLTGDSEHISQGAGKVVWYSNLFKNFPQFVLIHMIKGFSVINEAEVGVFSEIPFELSL